MIEDLQEVSDIFGWEHHRLYPGWTSTKEFVDTGERMEFMTPLGQDHHSEDSDGPDSAPSDDLSDGEDVTDRESVVWDVVLAMTGTDRYHLCFAFLATPCDLPSVYFLYVHCLRRNSFKKSERT